MKTQPLSNNIFLWGHKEVERDREEKNESNRDPVAREKEWDWERCISCFNLKGTHRAGCGDVLAPVGGGMAHWRLQGNQFVCLLSWCFVAVTVHCSLPPLQHALLNGIYKTCGLCRLSSSSLSHALSFLYPPFFLCPFIPSLSFPPSVSFSISLFLPLFVSHSSHQSSIMWWHRSFQDAHSHSLRSQSRPALC